MFKFATTLFTVFSIVMVSSTAPTLAQPQAGPDTQPAVTQNTNTANKPDLQQVFAKETEKFKADTAVFDPVKTDIENSKQQAQKKGWSTTKKTLVITAIAVGLAAILFIAIKYHKDCLRSDPENCSPSLDEYCVCLEYERRIPKE